MTKSNCSRSLPSQGTLNFPNKLNRFISIDRMFDIISKQEIKTSDPKNWEDKNDVYALDAYKNKLGFKTLFAVCFLMELETIYHWSIFSEKMNACCVEFNAKELINSISSDKCFRHGSVKYIKIKDLKSELKNVEDLPFRKRDPYRNESEYRIIFQAKTIIDQKKIPIKHSMIKNITINRHLSNEVFELIKREIEDKYEIDVNRSTVIENEEWINFVNNIKT